MSVEKIHPKPLNHSSGSKSKEIFFSKVVGLELERQINDIFWLPWNKFLKMSGGSSKSVVQRENLMWRMHKTPGTPIKSASMVTPKKSESKRSLFQSGSPSKSDDLGLMMPLSPSSCSSINTFDSPQFSPNGKFSTPPKACNIENLADRDSPKLSFKRIEVKSSLFPDLKLPTPKTPKSLIYNSLCSSLGSLEKLDEGTKRLNTPPTSESLYDAFKNDENAKTKSGISNHPDMTQEVEEAVNSGNLQKPKLKPLSSESFYGFEKKISKAKTSLFIDSLEPKSKGRQLDRSFDRDSVLSNRSFVSGGTRKSRSKIRRSKSSNGDRRRPPHVGVWHNIKKPRKIKKIIKSEKPLITPESRVELLLSKKDNKIKVKSKPFFKENSRKKFAKGKKRNRNDGDDNEIIDSFPDHLIKRQKLPTATSNVHPAFDETKNLERTLPDPNKKFLKYGQTRAATFTLNDNVKLRISDGTIKLQTPKKRRKLYSGKKDMLEDFNDFEEGDNDMEENIQGILNRLQNEKDVNSELKANMKLKKINSLNSHDAGHHNSKNIFTTPPKLTSSTRRSPLKTVSNLPALICNDFECDDNEDNAPGLEDASVFEKRSSETALSKTGNMVSYLTRILVNKEESVDTDVGFKDIENENSPPKEDKLYSLFYKQNWNKAFNANESSNSKIFPKKKFLVPDDQYLLDAGQKSIGIVTCKKCGVMYQAGDFADEATHNNFHNHLPELRFPGWNNERVVGKFSDGRVIMILNADPKIWWQKVSKIVDIVDQELGYPEASVQSLFYKTVYLYINEKTKQIAGCLIAEECKTAYRMFPPLEGIEIDSCSKDPSPCKIGISRIWTALSHRRKGIASRMVDCLQRTFFFGEIVPMDRIAFSVPSPAGKAFAQKVTGRLDFLVYGFP